jgi:PAS domain S-box-containing protein
MTTILIIDDKKDNLISFSAILKEMHPGFRMITALSGREGIEKAINNQPDVILLDIIMPKMDGYETCIRLKDDKRTKHIPVILITAIRTDSESRIRGLEIGADAFLSKPIDPTELTAQLNVMLRIGRAEKQLRRDLEISEDRFEKIFSQAPVGIEVYDQNGLLIDINQECLNIFGVTSASEVKGFKLFEDPNISAKIKKRLQSGESISYDTEFDFDQVRKHNLYKTSRRGVIHLHLSVTPYNISINGGGGYLVHVLDITDKMQAEIQLKESEEKFRLLHINSPDMTMLQNPDGELIYISPQVEKVLGYKAEEFMGISFPEQIHPDDRDKAHIMSMKALGGEDVLNFEYRFIGVDQELIWLSHTARPIVSDGKVVRVQSSVRNITRRKESELELAKYRFQMEELVKERTSELEAKNEKLENFNSLFVGREFRIKELKDEVEQLEEKLKKMEENR